MARRQINVRFKCGHDGCKEIGYYSCDNRAEYADLQRRYHPDKWRCVRHTRPEEVLSAANVRRVTEYSIIALDHGQYWGTDKPGSGFMYGPGFKAYAEDFPEGTRVRITAELILPEAS